MQQIDPKDAYKYSRLTGIPEDKLPDALLNCHHNMTVMMRRMGSKFLPHTYPLVVLISGISIEGGVSGEEASEPKKVSNSKKDEKPPKVDAPPKIDVPPIPLTKPDKG